MYPDSASYILQRLPYDGIQFLCVPCASGKAKRAPFPNETTAPRLPLEAVSTETTGPIDPPDLDGNRYLQLIVDAVTGHTTGRLLQKKSEAAAAILAKIRRLHLAIGCTTKHYHSENAKGQRTKR